MICRDYVVLPDGIYYRMRWLADRFKLSSREQLTCGRVELRGV